MCRKAKSCVLLGDDPSAWSRTVPLQPPSWFEQQLDIFRESAERAAHGRRDEAISILRTIKSDEMRYWFDEHGQMSGLHRKRKLGIAPPVVGVEELDPLRSPARFEKQVFERDCYTCRYCGLRTLAKEVLTAFERAVGLTEFRTQGTNVQQHGIVLAFKIVADHVMPHAYHGRTALDNLVTACPSCNYGKFNYTLEQLGLDHPCERPPSNSGWDGLTSLVSGLKNHALQVPEITRNRAPVTSATTSRQLLPKTDKQALTSAPNKTVKFGDWDVPVLMRDWVAPARMPYRKTYLLTTGQHWSEAATSEKMWEHYALLPDGQAVPVGILIARELMAAGASSAAFTELWGGRCVLVGPDLVCLADDGPLQSLVAELRAANENSLGGLPDVLGIFPNGRIAMREAKNVFAKDKLGPKQHNFACAAQRLLGERLDLAVVEWGLPSVP